LRREKNRKKRPGKEVGSAEGFHPPWKKGNHLSSQGSGDSDKNKMGEGQKTELQHHGGEQGGKKKQACLLVYRQRRLGKTTRKCAKNPDLDLPS